MKFEGWLFIEIRFRGGAVLDDIGVEAIVVELLSEACSLLLLLPRTGGSSSSWKLQSWSFDVIFTEIDVAIMFENIWDKVTSESYSVAIATVWKNDKFTLTENFFVKLPI